MNIPKTVYLYDEGIKDLDWKGIKDFIADNFGNIKIRLVRLKKKAVETRGLLFDFIATQKAFGALKYSKDKNSCHIILTNTLFASLDVDNRPHIRSGIYSFPSVISASGTVEGPAKPRQYYFYKQKYVQLGIWVREEHKVKQKFKGRFIDYEDKRINEALKGYIAQALFFYITGEPFCAQKACRLYNAHWQQDLIYSQIKKGKLCRFHAGQLKNIRENRG